MGWNEMDGKGQDTDKVARAKEEEAALRGQVRKALGEPTTPLYRYLDALVRGQSYAPGRPVEDVAFAEGQRALARQLMKLGGVHDR